MLYYSPNVTCIGQNKRYLFCDSINCLQCYFGHNVTYINNCHILIVIKCRFNYFNNWQGTHSQYLTRQCCCIFIRSWEPSLWVSVTYFCTTVVVLKLLICIQHCIYRLSLLPLTISSSIICTACQAAYSQGYVLDISLIPTQPQPCLL